MPLNNNERKPTRQELFQGALASIDELIAAQTEKLELLKAHKKGLIQKFSSEMKATPFQLPDQVKEDAARIVAALLGENNLVDPAMREKYGHLKKLKPQVPIKVQTPEGVLDSTFNGYFDMTPIGKGLVPSVGYMVNGSLTHGGLKNGHKILTPIPSPEEWNAYEESISRAIIPTAKEPVFQTG